MHWPNRPQASAYRAGLERIQLTTALKETTVQEIDADQVVESTWHYDGPYDPETVISAAQALPRLVRYLNNATRPGKASLRYASNAYWVTSQFAAVADLLPQALGQLAHFLETHSADPSLYDDRRDRPATQTAHEAVTELRNAVTATRQLARRLRAVCAAAEHLGNDDLSKTEWT